MSNEFMDMTDKYEEDHGWAWRSNTFYKINPKVDDIPEIYGKENDGVRLLFLALKAGLYMKGK